MKLINGSNQWDLFIQRTYVNNCFNNLSWILLCVVLYSKADEKYEKGITLLLIMLSLILGIANFLKIHTYNLFWVYFIIILLTSLVGIFLTKRQS